MQEIASPSYGISSFYWNVIFVVSAAFVLKWAICLKFFFLPGENLVQKLKNLHGKEVPDKKDGGIFEAVIFAPIFEEAIFRFPIILCLRSTGDMVMAFGVMLISAPIFGFAHRSNLIKFADGTEIKLPWIFVANITIAGFVYGVLAACLNSLLPGIFCHALWNLSVLMFNNRKGNEYLIKIAKAIQ